jgi:hypothetical protein
MKRRDFSIGLLLATATKSAPAQEPAKRHRIAIVISTGPATRVNDPASHTWQPFWKELRRLGDVEGKISPSSGIRVRGGPRAMPTSLARSSAGTRTLSLPLAPP